MASRDSATSQPSGPLRLWPGAVLVTLQWLLRFVLPILVPEALGIGIMSALGLGLAVLVWWTFFSRATRLERFGGALLMLAALAATPPILHESVATGAMGMLFYLYALPGLCLALVVWAWASRGLAPAPRRATLAATILLACAGWGLVRTEGFTADVDSSFAWRWSPTPEERLLARQAGPLAKAAPRPPASEAASALPGLRDPAITAEAGTATPPAPAPPEWPGFRGPRRDGVVPGVRIATDWSAAPPAELWRRPIGPGWSSFAVAGDRIYTQEQRGEQEVVACYDRATGLPVWQHGDAVRFWESNAGPGPRATPTVSGGRVYALGATGLLNALEAADGAPVWSRDVAAETGKKLPDWGFSASPLVVGDLVVAAVGGVLAAYDLATGESRWSGPDGGQSYSSPHLATIAGTSQILFLSQTGLIGVSPADGNVLWEHAWRGFPIVQPAVAAEGDLLLGVTADSGLRRLAVERGDGGWRAEELWTSIRLKPYFNDFVVHEGHAYGFDGGILACIELEEGRRRWKGGRYGHGQLILLPDQDLLLVVSERGELVLVAASPDGFTELTRAPAVAGKTWNHPVLVGDLLLVRNDREMAAFRLPPPRG